MWQSLSVWNITKSKTKQLSYICMELNNTYVNKENNNDYDIMTTERTFKNVPFKYL